MHDHLPWLERLALQAEVAWLHKCGISDYQLAKAFAVSPGSVNKTRLHAQVGRRVAQAMYVAMGVTAEMLLSRHRKPTTPGCMACEGLRFHRDGGIAIIKLCQEHTLMASEALYA